MKKLILLSSIALLFISCEKSNSYFVKGSGPIVSEIREFTDFSEIESKIAASIDIYESDEQYIRIIMQESLFPYLETTVSGSTLNIGFGNTRIRDRKEIFIEIYTPSLKSFKLSGAGNVYSELPINDIIISGSGKVKCIGQTDELYVNLSGSGEFDLYSMPVNNASIKISGAGKVKVNVEEQLDVKISGIGQVYYIGNPIINKNISGIGEVSSRN